MSDGTELDFNAPLEDFTDIVAPLGAFVAISNQMELIELSLEPEAAEVFKLPKSTVYGAGVSVLVVAVA